jgi:hypothetical protein
MYLRFASSRGVPLRESHAVHLARSTKLRKPGLGVLLSPKVACL